MRILITGVTTRAIAESAKAAGHSFVTLDYFGDFDQKGLCENYSLKRDFGLPFGATELYQASRSLSFEAVVYTANLENHPEVVGKFATDPAHRQHVLLLGNRAPVLARVRHWPTLYGFLHDQGEAVPTTVFTGHPPAGSERCWLCKPVRSGGGQNIAFWSSKRTPRAGFFLQEYLPGIPCSASFVANGRECVVMGLTEQLIGLAEFGAEGFHYCGNILPPDVAAEAAQTDLLARIRHIASGLTREFGLVGVNGLDFLLDGTQIYPLEVNPRYSASMELIEQAYGLSIFDLHVRAVAQGQLPDFDVACAGADSRGGATAPAPARQYYGKAILYAARDAQAPDTRGWPERWVRDVPFPGEHLARGGPVCTVLASGPTRAACFARLVAQAEALKGEIYA